MYLQQMMRILQDFCHLLPNIYQHEQFVRSQ